MTTSSLASTPTIEGESTSRVGLTPAAIELLQKLANRNGRLMFHQSGGCCDGSSPMCYPQGEFRTGDSDILLGTFTLPDLTDDVAKLDFWMSREQFELWKHTHITVDVVDGRGGGFSLESPEGKRFLIRSEIMPA